MTAARPRLLALTPAADLYGSDRALLTALPDIAGAFRPVVVSAQDGPMIERVRAAGVEAVVSRDWALRRRSLTPRAFAPTVVNVAATLRLLRRLRRGDAFDVVYVNTMANAMLPLLGPLVGRPVVVHVREVPRDRARMARLLLGLVRISADRVLCNSSFTAGLIADARPALAERLRVVPDGVDPLPPARASLRPDRFEITCVARIHPKKGIGDAIAALGLCRHERPHWHLHVHGDALAEHRSLADELRAEVTRHGLDGRVHWHGFGADTAALYDRMDVAIVPSALPEEFSLVTAEAQMSGLPVVATGPGGPSDIVVEGTTGIIVPPRDAAALATALARIDDLGAERRAWGAAGRTRSLERFSAERYGPAVAAELAAALSAA